MIGFYFYILLDIQMYLHVKRLNIFWCDFNLSLTNIRLLSLLTKAVSWRCSVKKKHSNILQNSQKNSNLRVSFSIKSKPTTILKKRLWHQCFPENVVKLSRIPFRGGFRGGDLVTCHPLFSYMTLQSQILVIESLFLTSVFKFMRKYLLSGQFSYMYSSCSNTATSLIKFSDNFFQEKLSISESSITGTCFRVLSWDNVGFLWKSQYGVRRCSTAYGMFYA